MKRYDVVATVDITLSIYADTPWEAQESAERFIKAWTPGEVTILTPPTAISEYDIGA